MVRWSLYLGSITLGNRGARPLLFVALADSAPAFNPALRQLLRPCVPSQPPMETRF